jgi:hypothetical protein
MFEGRNLHFLQFVLFVIKVLQVSLTVHRAFITSIFNGEAIRVFKITKKDDGSSSTVQAGFDFSCVSVSYLNFTFFTFTSMRFANSGRSQEGEDFNDNISGKIMR